ncbi:MAG: formylglycine-generating enzyme family protein [Desulfovibrio sp.]|jgi:hypothetical protein|nr:formylglycine-generating enzyme family protein [Desulfovibrio sp.]
MSEGRIPVFCGKRKRLAVFCAAAALLLPLPSETEAALSLRRKVPDLAEVFNPVPAEGDFILPMPCGAGMVFSAAGVRAGGFLEDFVADFGCGSCSRTGDGYYESSYRAALGAPLSASDLPEDALRLPPGDAPGEYSFYLIGKYEISNFQWKAIMEGWCPSDSAPMSPEDALPKTGLTWIDAMNFASAYTEWLLLNTPDALPKFAGDSKNTAYLRLPTETEWEYAARGAQAALAGVFQGKDFFPLEEGLDYKDYAVFRPDGAGGPEEVSPIGSKRPNPLGLYDTAGNAAEMVIDNFRFSLGGRLHGSAGGTIRKGGSFLSSVAEIMPGRREEVAPFLAAGPNRVRDLGARLVVSGINTPQGERPLELAREWRSRDFAEKAGVDGPEHPLKEIDRLLAWAGDSGERDVLERLRNAFKDKDVAFAEEHVGRVDELIRGALFMLESVRNYAVRHKEMRERLEECLQISGQADKEENGKRNSDLARDMENYRVYCVELRASVEAALHFYRRAVEDALNFSPLLFDARIEAMRVEFMDDDLLNANMRVQADIYERHTRMLREGSEAALLTSGFLLRDILPDNLHPGLVNVE